MSDSLSALVFAVVITALLMGVGAIIAGGSYSDGFEEGRDSVCRQIHGSTAEYMGGHCVRHEPLEGGLL